MRIRSAIPAETLLAASPMPLTGKNLPAFRRSLLHWYDQNRRDLPWRRSRDPYRIWLSEIMLQQTRVAAVLDHYRIFLERFPNVQSLAAASEDAVLAAWSGLGYYRRARMLHQCARELAQKHAGRFPQRAEDLQNLPGIGRYTAAAVASIAFAEPIAVVDGNVERVVQRFLGGHRTTPQIWQHAQALLARSRPGDFNQAMMELGATVCVPGEPRCLVCPIRRWCVTQPSRQAEAAQSQEDAARPRPAKRHPRFVRRRRTSGVCSTSAMAESASCNGERRPHSCPACGNCRNHPSLHVGCPGRAVAHVSPFHHRYRLHSARASECGVNQCRSCRQK